MAPSSGHLLVPKVLRIAKFAVSKTTAFVRSKLPSTTTTTSSATSPVLQPIRISTNSHPVHPLAHIRQARSQRFLHTTVRNRSSTTKVGKAIRQRGFSPFASTLRPNLTGGTLPRTAGGYGLGGVRNFSSTPSCQAHVIQNVNAGIRAFFVSGGKARFGGVDLVTGEKRFKTVTPTEDKVLRAFDTLKSTAVKGTSLEFGLSPTVTALLPSTVGFEPQQTLNAEGLISALSTDFARALKTLSLTLADLKRLSALGSLPISLTSTPKGPVLSVRFPGCDATTVSILCEELGIFNGVVREDAEWDESHEVEMALLFPFAPTGQSEDAESEVASFFERKPAELEWQGMMTPSTALPTPSSTGSYEEVEETLMPAIEESEGYESMRESDYGDEDPYVNTQTRYTSRQARAGGDGMGDLEGIYQFLSECDNARRR